MPEFLTGNFCKLLKIPSNLEATVTFEIPQKVDANIVWLNFLKQVHALVELLGKNGGYGGRIVENLKIASLN